MKILFVHNCYQQAGGEDNVVAAEAKLLADYGHKVELWNVDNKGLPGRFSQQAKTALTTSYSAASKAIGSPPRCHLYSLAYCLESCQHILTKN
ncbi:MAG: hypothetical protein ACXW1W_03985 [Methylococcaceae bacterium]